MDPLSRLGDDLLVVLVGPQNPENVGTAARAMANFGLRQMVIVDPAESFDPERARWRAPGAEAVLAAARFVPTLADALAGVHRAVATTARHRRHEPEVVDPDGLAQGFFDSAPGLRTAIVFGREDVGLHADEVARCGTLLRIPTAEHASLNLGMAVLLVASRLFEGARKAGADAPGRLVVGRRKVRSTLALQVGDADDRPADLAAVEPVVDGLMQLLADVAYTGSTSPERVAVTLRELAQRATPTVRETRALRGMVATVSKALGRARRGLDQAAGGAESPTGLPDAERS